MTKLLRSLALFIVLPLSSLPALAKPKHKASHKTAHTQKKVSGQSKPDLEAKALIRKRAPFFLEEKFRGSTVRLNKDGTIAREGELGTAASGHWLVKSGKLKIKWNTGEEYGYKLTFKGKNPIIAGMTPNKSKHYILTSAD